MKASRKVLRKVAAFVSVAGWRIPSKAPWKTTRPIGLLYHDIPTLIPGGHTAAAFEAHVRFLQEYFEIVHPRESEVERKGKLRVYLTFDDGFRNNFEVAAPILKRLNAPAIFFVSARHLEEGKFLWFQHLRAVERFWEGDELSFHGRRWDMRRPQRAATVREMFHYLGNLKPHPHALYATLDEHFPNPRDFVPKEHWSCVAGMSPDQVQEMANDALFEIGNHTVDHPYLSRCDKAEARRQIEVCSQRLRQITGKPCRTLAYPVGDYNAETLAIMRECGFAEGTAVTPKLNLEPCLELPRFCISSPSVPVLGFKVQHGELLRKLGFDL